MKSLIAAFPAMLICTLFGLGCEAIDPAEPNNDTGNQDTVVTQDPFVKCDDEACDSLDTGEICPRWCEFSDSVTRTFTN